MFMGVAENLYIALGVIFVFGVIAYCVKKGRKLENDSKELITKTGRALKGEDINEDLAHLYHEQIIKSYELLPSFKNSCFEQYDYALELKMLDNDDGMYKAILAFRKNILNIIKEAKEEHEEG